MKRFLITSPKYEGQAEILYNDKGTLCMIDLRFTDMDETTVPHFKSAVPSILHKLLAGQSFSKETVIVEAEFQITFELFYKDYPHKRQRYKVEAAWNKLTQSDQVKAFYSLHDYKKYLTRTGCFAMIGDRYLKDREFETEWNKSTNKV